MTARRATVLALAWLAIGWSTGHARAQTCSFSMESPEFGTREIIQGVRPLAVGALTATCSGEPGQRVRVCPRFGAGSGGSEGGKRLLRDESRTTSIPFALFQYPGGAPWDVDLWRGSVGAPSLDVPLGIGGSGTATLVVGASIDGSLANLPAGRYSATFAGEDAVISYAYATGGCAQQGRALSGSAIFTVGLTTLPTCSVATTSLEFGRLPDLDQAADSSAVITIQCTAGTRYDVALGVGNAVGGDPTRRRMRSGPDILLYGTYRDSARALPWGSTMGKDTLPGIGNGRPQPILVYGRIPPQAGIPAGRYTDAIIVSVSY